MYFNPTVIEKIGTTEKEFTLSTRLLKDRIIFLSGEVDEVMSDLFVQQLMYLDFQNHDDITVYINSPGGLVSAGLLMYDVMNFVKSDIKTVVSGQACSMGSFLASAGTKGKRYSFRNSRLMYHQVSGGAIGTATDMKITLEETIIIKEKLNKILSENTYGKVTFHEMEHMTDRDKWLSPSEAIELGLIDEII